MKIVEINGREILAMFAAFWLMMMATSAAVFFAARAGATTSISVSPSSAQINIPPAAPSSVTLAATVPVTVQRVETEKAGPLPDIRLYAMLPSVKGEAPKAVSVPLSAKVPVHVEVPAVTEGELNETPDGVLLPPPNKEALNPSKK